LKLPRLVLLVFGLFLEYCLRLFFGLAGLISGLLQIGKRFLAELIAPSIVRGKSEAAFHRPLRALRNQAIAIGGKTVARVAHGHQTHSTGPLDLPPITSSRLWSSTTKRFSKERILALTFSESGVTYFSLNEWGETYASGSARETGSGSLLQICNALAEEHQAQRTVIGCCNSSNQLDFVRWAQLIKIPQPTDMIFFSHRNLRNGYRDWVMNHHGELRALSTQSSWPIILGDHQTNVVPGLPLLCTVDLLQTLANTIETKVENAQEVQELSVQVLSGGGQIWECNVPKAVSVEKCQPDCGLSFPTRPALVARTFSHKNPSFMNMLSEHEERSCCTICYTTSFETVALTKEKHDRVALLVSPYPSHPIRHGNQKRMVDLGAALQRAGYRTLFAFSQDPESSERDVEQMRTFWGTIEVLPSSEHPTDDYGTPFDGWIDHRIPGIVRSLCVNERVDVVICAYIWMSKALCGVPAHCKKVIDTHDRMTGRFALLEQFNLEPGFFSCTEKHEAKYLSRADSVVAISREEKEWFQSLNPRARVETISHLEEPRSVWQPSNSEIPTFGLIASSNQINVLSLQEFLQCILARKGALPYRLRIAGRVGGQVDYQTKTRLQNRFHENVEFLGFIRDLEVFYSEVDAVVAPIMFGTGMSIKSIEPIFLGIPMLSTDAGARGIPTKHPDHRHSSIHSLETRLENVDENDLRELAELSVHLAHDIHLSSQAGLRALLT